MRAKNRGRTGGDLRELIDKDRPLLAQLMHDMGVMHDLFPHIDRSRKAFEGLFHDLDGPVNACAESARFPEENLRQ